jgi:hypothetical protein
MCQDLFIFISCAMLRPIYILILSGYGDYEL